MTVSKNTLGQNQPKHDSEDPLDKLTRLALLKILEPKPQQNDDGNWFGVPKAVLISGFGALVLALFNWYLSIKTDANKLSYELIKQAVTAQDQEQAARNLRFLSRLKLISVEEDQLNVVLEDEMSRPLFSSPDGSLAYRIDENGMVEFEGDWVERNIVSETIPQLVGVKLFGSDQPFNGTVRLNRAAMSAAIAAFAEIESAGLQDRILSFDAGFVPRALRGNVHLSNHALGNSFDLNARWNIFGEPPIEAGQEGSVEELVPIFAKHGFIWGGEWTRPDAMHFEFKAATDSNSPQP
ncbi:MAG: M15 family metallopeptidase [Rhizobiaceae bacterium]